MTTEIWCSAMQPRLFPPVYLMARMARVHHWVVLEEAQYDRECVTFTVAQKAGCYERGPSVARIVPTPKDPSRRSRFCDLLVQQPAVFAGKTLFGLQNAYGKQKAFRELQPWLQDMLAELPRFSTVNDICQHTLECIADVLGLQLKFHKSRDLVRERPSEPTAWMASFCSQLHCTDYIQGRAASEAYFVKGPFEEAACRTWGQAYTAHYHTLGGHPADARMSILDALLTQGLEATRELITADQPRGWCAGTAVLLARG